MDSTCTHAGCILAQRSELLRCGCHGAVFDAATGESISGPGGGLQPLRRLGIEVKGESVFVTGL
jgi:nitrite reductase/ring-hydroxylating ferredoxin subunit